MVTNVLEKGESNQLTNFLIYSIRIEAISTKYDNTLESKTSFTSPAHSSLSKVTVVQSDHFIPLSIIKNLSVTAIYQLKDHDWSAIVL